MFMLPTDIRWGWDSSRNAWWAYSFPAWIPNVKDGLLYVLAIEIDKK